jgi:aubergine-like protein
LGRDALPKFKYWKSGSESAACRFVRTACDVLGPRGDAKNGCRQYWDAFCQEKLNTRSKVTSFRMNRFNNFFQGAAALFYHRSDIELFSLIIKQI